jgi:hypothetical protein
MIFHKYKLIIVGIPKNASSSLYDLLKNKTDRSHDHRTFLEEYSEHDSDLLSTYTSIAIIRNPYDRFLSACHQIKRDSAENFEATTQEIIEREILYNPRGLNEIFYTQNYFTNLGNRILVDKLFRYETLHKEWEEFVKEYNKTSQFKLRPILPVSNKTENRKSWQEEFKQLTQDQLDLINGMYERDFELFNYEMIKKI